MQVINGIRYLWKAKACVCYTPSVERRKQHRDYEKTNH